MDLPKFWIKQFKNYAYTLAKINPHILFLDACLKLGLTPNGLTSKPPISGSPQYMWPKIIKLHQETSSKTTLLVIEAYKIQQSDLSEKSISLTQLLINHQPHLVEIILDSVNKANKLQDNLAKNKLKKLSQLCMSHIRTVGYISATGQPPNRPTQTFSILGEKPSLATILNLPTPVGQLPKLPQIPPKPRTEVTQSPTTSETKSVLNLSNHDLTDAETSLLSKGLSFTPVQNFDLFNLSKDVFSFARNLRLKNYFAQLSPAQDNITKVEDCLSKFKPPSNWDPPPLPPDHPIELYINYIMQSITDPKFQDNLPKTDNLTKSERSALNSLKRNKDIMILPADKGSTTVVLNKSDYLNEARNQLSDQTTYKLLKENPTEKYNQQLTTWLQTEGPRQNIPLDTLNLLINNEPTTPQLYLLPKIHKDQIPPPGRPIVASCNSATERISAFLDSHLQPFVQSLPSHVRDTNHFLERLSTIKTPLPSDTIIATIDVTSLYTNIPHCHGLSAVEFFLNQRPNHTSPSTAFLVSIAKFILEKNNFQFEGQNYLQIKGTAMGTRMAPSYANLYMGRLEQQFLAKQQNKPDCWFRYIDDIFLVWTSGQESLIAFITELNSFGPLNFTCTTSTSELNFLDVNVKLVNGSLQTGIHIKPTNHLQYLHYDSSHPTNTKRSIPFSQAIRGKRICSSEDELRKFNDKITEAFVSRGYPRPLVTNQIKRAQSDQRTQPKPKHDQEVRLITTYHHGLQSLNKILIDGYKILQASPHTRELLKSPPTTLFRQPNNLKNILVKPKIPDPQTIKQQTTQPNGSYPCDSTKCKTCEIHVPSTTFNSSKTHQSYKISGHHTCNSSNVIYQLQCQMCPAQYVGLTSNSLRTRMNGHRQDVKNQYKDKPVVQHAASHNNKDFNSCYTTKILKALPPTCNQSELRRWELAHQWVTKSRDPPNLNLR